MDDEHVEEIVKVPLLDDTEDSQLVSCLEPVECMEEIHAAAFAKKLPTDVESSSQSLTSWSKKVEHIESYVTICFDSTLYYPLEQP